MSLTGKGKRMQRRTIALLTAPVLLTSLAACGSTGTDSAADGAYPVTVENCGVDVVFEQQPERVVLLETAPVTILDGLGVMDSVVSLAGVFDPAYYSDDLNAKIDEIPTLSDDIDASGHLMLSQEVVIAEQPDLVLGLPDGVTREGLDSAGANTIIQDIYCPEGPEEATTFDTLYGQVDEYGQIFGKQTEADELNASLKERVKKVTDQTADGPERTAAVLYPTVGGGPLYTYGNTSMAQPQLDAAGFTNVFEEQDERVFEVSIEELIDRDPDVLVLLGQGEELDELEVEVERLPGSDSLTALEDGNVLAQQFNFTEPPSPLAVDGLERIVDEFGTGE